MKNHKNAEKAAKFYLSLLKLTCRAGAQPERYGKRWRTLLKQKNIKNPKQKQYKIQKYKSKLTTNITNNNH